MATDISTCSRGADARLRLCSGTERGTSVQGRLFLPSTSNGLDSVAIADVNGDGRLDVVGSHQAFDVISVRYGRGDGSFSLPDYRPMGPGSADLAVADF